MKKACALLLAVAIGSAGALAACGRGLDDEKPFGSVDDQTKPVANSATPGMGVLSPSLPTFEFKDTLGVDGASDVKTGQ